MSSREILPQLEKRKYFSGRVQILCSQQAARPKLLNCLELRYSTVQVGISYRFYSILHIKILPPYGTMQWFTCFGIKTISFIAVSMSWAEWLNSFATMSRRSIIVVIPVGAVEGALRDMDITCFNTPHFFGDAASAVEFSTHCRLTANERGCPRCNYGTVEEQVHQLHGNEVCNLLLS